METTLATLEEKNTKNTIQEGDQLLIYFEDDTTYLVRVVAGKKHSIHRGRPIELSDLIGKPYGSWLEVGGRYKAILLSPTIEDLIMKARRESGIIYPKDAAVIMMRLGIHSGSRVIEVGTGSGALTLALADQVAPAGKVYTYDRREDFSKLAFKNIQKAGLESYVDFSIRSAHEPFNETEVDAVISDVPEPWHEADNIRKSLKTGGRVATLNPTYNQIEKTSEAFTKAGFTKIEAMEILVRGILARPGKTRPEQRMCGHTEFILTAISPHQG